jgi:hypothetical protein
MVKNRLYTHCLPQGVPKIDAVAYPWEFLPALNSVVIIYEIFGYWRRSGLQRTLFGS